MKDRVVSIVPITVFLLGGCVFAPSGPGDWDNNEGRLPPTIGQELLDLDRAHDDGVISDTEYERAKERILER